MQHAEIMKYWLLTDEEQQVIAVNTEEAEPPVYFTWTVTAPNPRHPGTGVDAGQRGWRLHAIPRQRGEDYEQWKRRPALCGCWPRHGWGFDLFIEDECARCQSAMTRREAAGEVFVDLSEVARNEYEAVEQKLCITVRERKEAGAEMSDEEIDDIRAALRSSIGPI